MYFTVIMKSLQDPAATRFTGAKVIAKDGAASLSVEAAFDTVRVVLCQSARKPSGVHAVVVHGNRPPSEQPDHLSLMNSVISATKQSWGELAKIWARSEASSKAKRASAVESDLACGSIRKPC
jgi:hypothetical protein